MKQVEKGEMSLLQIFLWLHPNMENMCFNAIPHAYISNIWMIMADAKMTPKVRFMMNEKEK